MGLEFYFQHRILFMLFLSVGLRSRGWGGGGGGGLNYHKRDGTGRRNF